MQLYHWNQLSLSQQQQLLTRPSQSTSTAVLENVATILTQVKNEGDQALFNFTLAYDQIVLKELSVSTIEWEEAHKLVSASNLKAMQFAIDRITHYHMQQIPQSFAVQTFAGIYCERQSRPIERVGLYVPGGSAPLVSTVLMLGVLAKLAKCPVKILCTPPNKLGKVDPHILVAAALCDIQHVFKVGGAQAIAAMAYGTASIPKVDKIFGPGNTWVTQAKIAVSQDLNGANIDMPAGPSELLIIADHTANPTFVAADLLSQAEHGADSQVLLVTLSATFAEQVWGCIQTQLLALSRRDIAKQALIHSRFLVVDTLTQAIKVSNTYAPEHLMLHTKTPEQYISLITNAGAVFLGEFTPETLGDYVTGANHVLPTCGYARSWSGLGVGDFMKFISVQSATYQGFKNLSNYAISLAELEGLQAHKEAILVRLESN